MSPHPASVGASGFLGPVAVRPELAEERDPGDLQLAQRTAADIYLSCIRLRWSKSTGK
jgi:hypothetical protein